MKENDNKYKAVELSDEQMAQVVGGIDETLTDDMLASGNFIVSEQFFYNNELYKVQSAYREMYLFRSPSGKGLLIPMQNFSF